MNGKGRGVGSIVLAMRDFSVDNLLSVRKVGSDPDIDCVSFSALYGPIVGLKSIGLFFVLWGENPEGEMSFKLLLERYQLSKGEFMAAIVPLEAMGLVRTIYQEPVFHFHLFPPRRSGKFLSHLVLSNLLGKTVGQAEAEKLAKRFKGQDIVEGDNVSAKFEDLYSVDGESPFGSLLSRPLKQRPNFSFSYEQFHRAMEREYPIYHRAMLSKKELNSVYSLSGLSGFSEEVMASFVARLLEPENGLGNRIDIDKLKSDLEDAMPKSYLREKRGASTPVHGDSPLAKGLRDMDRIPPLAFLTKLQKGHRPAPSDVALLEELTVDMGLSYGATNALIAYVLQEKDNALPSAYVKKIAGSLVRSDIDTAIDAYEYLKAQKDRSRSRKKTQNANDGENVARVSRAKEVETAAPEELTDEELELLGDF